MLAQLREGIAEIYVQKKIDQMEDDNNIQNWNKFVKEVKTAFSNKSKVADAEWKIKTFRQEKEHIVDFIIEFKVLAMKTETDNIYAIFLLKKNIKSNIIKTILGYLYNYRTRTEIIHKGRETPMEIRKSKDNYNKDKKSRCFNCNIYRHMAKDC